ncbi:DUF4199 domain-containing protein [uncultured Chitinophaga sp.]|uniref:DUF4199 domain-containing protein n=1 Tax=uncultured Chitinophaga sp. TaxID=339340 RepID=UPI0025D108A5|nr:DUF4199 domain-containing protein [uncultured Chitinophaga sp.]
MKKNVIVFGLIAGLMVSIWLGIVVGMCMNGKIHLDNGMLYGYASMILAFSMVFVGVKNYRDKYCGGIISFGQAFKTGLFITLIASTIYVLVWLVSYYTLIPNFFEVYSENYLSGLKAGGASQEVMAEEMASMAKYAEWYKNPLFVVGATYMEILPVGLVVTLVSALLLKRKGTRVATDLQGVGR